MDVPLARSSEFFRFYRSASIRLQYIFYVLCCVYLHNERNNNETNEKEIIWKFKRHATNNAKSTQNSESGTGDKRKKSEWPKIAHTKNVVDTYN